MKELDSFTVEQLNDFIKSDHAQCGDVAALARIALAAKRAEPVAWEVKGILCHSKEEADSYVGEPVPLYEAPQLNSPEIPEGWIKCSDQMPEVGDVVITAYQGCTNIGQMERSGKTYRYFTSIASGRELPATHWMPLLAAPESE
ncbi:DUF551 domain-containing protein [Yersinia enterocolitica]|uniref:DUF551 domain-containing protein n=1 Tax=Yersinia enterocolitica TaxID=630 RepID=UPI003D0456EE